MIENLLPPASNTTNKDAISAIASENKCISHKSANSEYIIRLNVVILDTVFESLNRDDAQWTNSVRSKPRPTSFSNCAQQK